MIPAGYSVYYSIVQLKGFIWSGPVVISLVAGGILMIVAEKFSKPSTARTLDEITYKQAFTIGMFQCLALWPIFSFWFYNKWWFISSRVAYSGS